MRRSKEILYHFTCSVCQLWFSIATTEKTKFNFDKTKLYCPHCGIRSVSKED